MANRKRKIAFVAVPALKFYHVKKYLIDIKETKCIP